MNTKKQAGTERRDQADVVGFYFFSFSPGTGI